MLGGVHTEQADGSAEYFGPYASDQLASLMARREQVLVAERIKMEQTAIAASWDWVKKYAEDFSTTVNRAWRSRSCRNVS